MDSVSQQIVDIVREWNQRDAEICFTDLQRMKIAAPPTIQKKIIELLDEKELIGLTVQTKHGTKRLLFVPEEYAVSAESTVIVRQNGMIIRQLTRIADSLETANIDNRTFVPAEPRRRKTDGRMQTKLWSEE